jgi:hypothetical protein
MYYCIMPAAQDEQMSRDIADAPNVTLSPGEDERQYQLNRSRSM